MSNVLKISVALLSVYTFNIGLNGCKKSTTNDPSTNLPTIISFSPSSDTINGKVIIAGTNFSATVSDNIVKFNGTEAKVSAASTTKLDVTVPQGATSGTITVSVNGQTATSTTSFTLLKLPSDTLPAVTNFASIAGIGYSVVINGANFSSVLSENTVTINGVAAIVTASSKTQITITVPDLATSGKIVISVNGKIITSATDIKILKLTVTTLAGTGIVGDVDGPGNMASFAVPSSIIADDNGTLYVADPNNNKIRKITPDGVVSTYAGTGQRGNTDGQADTATFYFPWGLAFDKNKNMFVSDYQNNTIRKITPSGVVSTFAGSLLMEFGSDNGTGAAAKFNNPFGLATDNDNNVYVADWRNEEIRKITPGGVVTTFAGNGTSGAIDGVSTSATFNTPFYIAIDANNNVFVTDELNNKIRKITPSANVTTFSGSGVMGSLDGPASIATFNNSAGIAEDVEGNFFIADLNNGLIRIVTPTGEVATLAGDGPNNASIDGIGHSASLNGPLGITIDKNGVLYITEQGSSKIRKITIQ